MNYEEKVLELFFNYPSRHWKFKEIGLKLGIPDNKVDRWLKLNVEKNVICKIIIEKKHPYYIANYDSSVYKTKKRLYALTQLIQTGFYDHLLSLAGVKSLILFGSLSRDDWYCGSDIDLFIYGNDSNLELAKFEKVLGRDIQLFTCRNKTDILNLGKPLLNNILKGNLIKGDLNFVEVSVSA